MNIEVKKTFLKDFGRIPKSVQLHVTDFLIDFHTMTDIRDMKNTKKLVGFQNFYRTRIGEYRVGWRQISQEEIIIDRVLHRKDIYKVYP